MFTEVALARTGTLGPTPKLNFLWPHPLGRGKARDPEKEIDTEGMSRDTERTEPREENRDEGRNRDTEGHAERERHATHDKNHCKLGKEASFTC